MKNKDGVTMAEIIISVTLVAIVLGFLFNVIITLKNQNTKNKALSTLLVNQAILTKEIENDFIKLTLKGVDYCTADDTNKFQPKNGLPNNIPLYCLKFKYRDSTDNGYLFYYQYNYATTTTGSTTINVVGYTRGTNKILRQTDAPPGTSGTAKIILDNTTTNYIITINLPITGNDGSDYGINLSYVYDGADFTMPSSSQSSYGFKINQS
jgi:type II secretory pathway pseudopilin PulG